MPYSRDSNLDPVKCQGEECKKRAATCLVHAEEANATKESKTWLDKNNIVSTMISDFTSCKVNSKPLPAKVLKKVRNKTRDDDNLQVSKR